MRARASNVEMIRRLSSVRSRTEPHAPHAIDSVCARPRTVSGAPHFEQASPRTFGASFALPPAIELSQARQPELGEFDVLPDEQQWRVFAVVDGREGPPRSRQVRDRRLVTGADGERQLAFAGDHSGALDVD